MALISTWDRAAVALQGWLGLRSTTQEQLLASASVDHTLKTTPRIDPHFIPRVPMRHDQLDVGLLGDLSKHGYKHAKEVTAETHPELHRVWVELCKRAGMTRVPQLIFAQSSVPNAGSLFNENAVVVTTGLLRRIDLRELTAVLGHELGHETSNHQTPRVLAYLTFGLVGTLAGSALAHRGGIGGLLREVENPGLLRRTWHGIFGKPGAYDVISAELGMVGGAALGGVVAKQLSVHPTELQADRKGAIISGDPKGLISALEKLEETHAPMRKTAWGTVKYYFHFLTSGYPSHATRVAKLERIAQSLPPETIPVYRLAEAPATPVPAQASPTSATTTPHAHIHQVMAAERVSEAPSLAVAAAQAG